MAKEELGDWEHIVTQDPHAGDPEYIAGLQRKFGAEVKHAPTSGNSNGIVIWRTEETNEKAVQHYLDERQKDTHGRVFSAVVTGGVKPEGERFLIPPDSVEHRGF